VVKRVRFAVNILHRSDDESEQTLSPMVYSQLSTADDSDQVERNIVND
jgi:hypothetical protein